MDFNWKLFEKTVFDAALKKIEILLIQSPSPLYVIALYPGNDTLFLGGNTIATHPPEPEDHIGDFSDLRWDLEQWQYQKIAIEDEILLNFEKQLKSSNEAKKLERKRLTIMAKVAKKLYQKVIKLNNITDDFIIFYHNNSPDVAKKSIPEKLFLKHFPRQDPVQMERLRVNQLPLEQQIVYYIQRLSQYDGISCEEADQKLIEIDRRAIPYLIEHLHHREIGWKCAYIIGMIGIPDQTAIKTLRELINEGFWFGSALSLLNDFEFLLEATQQKSTRYHASDALATPFSSWRNHCKRPLPLDYTPIETVLSFQHPEITRIIAEEIGPGRGFCNLTEDEVDEALRGLQSRYLPIRKHAISVLGDLKLNKTLGKKVIPPIINAFHDPDPEIHRLAALQLKYFKKKVKPYQNLLEPFLERDDIKNDIEKLLEGLS